jgi:uncharacterized membrane protein
MTIAQAPPRDVSTARQPRVASIDILRGAIMVLMAIDHVRVYSGVPAGGPTAGVFFTRWVTHFCAPGFVFFAGTSAFLASRAAPADHRRLARYLVTRGLLLVLLELTIVRFTWTFNVDYGTFVLAGVIWMLGWCMVLLAPLVRLRPSTAGAIGLATIVLQPVFSVVPRALPAPMRAKVGWLWEFVYPAGFEPPPPINILYVIVPWIGVMAAGFAFGALLARDPAARRRLCLRIGLGATAAFLVLGGLRLALSPASQGAPPALFRLLNQSKYPPSVPFLLMTLGPMIALMPFVDAARGWAARALTTFGRVPLFYYLLHIPAIHVAALVVNLLREGSAHPEWYATAPYASVPPDHRWGLPLLYLVFVVVIAILYVPCRWYADVKRRRRNSWLRYL